MIMCLVRLFEFRSRPRRVCWLERLNGTNKTEKDRTHIIVYVQLTSVEHGLSSLSSNWSDMSDLHAAVNISPTNLGAIPSYCINTWWPQSVYGMYTVKVRLSSVRAYLVCTTLNVSTQLGRAVWKQNFVNRFFFFFCFTFSTGNRPQQLGSKDVHACVL